MHHKQPFIHDQQWNPLTLICHLQLELLEPEPGRELEPRELFLHLRLNLDSST